MRTEINSQYGVMCENINYLIIETEGKMYLQVCQGKTIIKFPITKCVIAGLNWHVNGGELPNNTVVKY